MWRIFALLRRSRRAAAGDLVESDPSGRRQQLAAASEIAPHIPQKLRPGPFGTMMRRIV